MAFPQSLREAPPPQFGVSSLRHCRSEGGRRVHPPATTQCFFTVFRRPCDTLTSPPVICTFSSSASYAMEDHQSVSSPRYRFKHSLDLLHQCAPRCSRLVSLRSLTLVALGFECNVPRGPREPVSRLSMVYDTSRRMAGQSWRRPCDVQRQVQSTLYRSHVPLSPP